MGGALLGMLAGVLATTQRHINVEGRALDDAAPAPKPGVHATAKDGQSPPKPHTPGVKKLVPLNLASLKSSLPPSREMTSVRNQQIPPLSLHSLPGFVY